MPPDTDGVPSRNTVSTDAHFSPVIAYGADGPWGTVQSPPARRIEGERELAGRPLVIGILPTKTMAVERDHRSLLEHAPDQDLEARRNSGRCRHHE
jgi:hypothetical protein